MWHDVTRKSLTEAAIEKPTFSPEGRLSAGKRTLTRQPLTVSFVEGFRMRAVALRWGLVGTSARVGKPPEEETAGSCRGVAMGKAGWGG